MPAAIWRNGKVTKFAEDHIAEAIDIDKKENIYAVALEQSLKYENNCGPKKYYLQDYI